MSCRGTIEVKGKGSMETYFLEGKCQKPEINVVTNPLASIPSESKNGLTYHGNEKCVLGTIKERN